MEAHCVNMELKYQNQALKDRQHGQILNETSNKSKIKKEIEVLESINIELKHSVAKLLAENEKLHKKNDHLKQTYKDLYDSIKKTRVQTKVLNDSLIAQILSLQTINLRKPVVQPPRNQSVVRQLNAFKSERPNFSKPWFASQDVVNNDLPKPVTPYYLPKVRESVLAKPHHVIAPSSSRNSSKESYGSNDMAHNYYLEEAKKKTQDKNKNLKPKEMPSARTHHTPNTYTPKPRSNNQTSRLVPNTVSQQPCIPSPRDDWDRLFQPMFDEYFTPSSIVVSPVQEDAALRAMVLAESPVSTSIDQDAPSTNNVLLIKLKWIYKVKMDEFGGDNPSHMYKLKKALYGLKQAPRAWYDMLSSFLISQHFSKGAVDPTLFTLLAGNDLLLAKPTKKNLQAVKRIFRYLKGTINMGRWYLKDTDMLLTAYADADYMGCQDTRRSTWEALSS
uniref:Putative mitochondrial protein n=1 Tax=Tanacetum cinerariifolium TaxID=118510 RepID=A0A6L2J494_TANCI|nr:putative mitochondrial protein [Tanacetum cinerariifolium]